MSVDLTKPWSMSNKMTLQQKETLIILCRFANITTTLAAEEHYCNQDRYSYLGYGEEVGTNTVPCVYGRFSMVNDHHYSYEEVVETLQEIIKNSPIKHEPENT